MLTWTHLWRAKSRPHPCTKSFCKFSYHLEYMYVPRRGKKWLLSIGNNLYQMPNAAPCISREDWSHDFNKTIKRQSKGSEEWSLKIIKWKNIAMRENAQNEKIVRCTRRQMGVGTPTGLLLCYPIHRRKHKKWNKIL